MAYVRRAVQGRFRTRRGLKRKRWGRTRGRLPYKRRMYGLSKRVHRLAKRVYKPRNIKTHYTQTAALQVPVDDWNNALTFYEVTRADAAASIGDIINDYSATGLSDLSLRAQSKVRALKAHVKLTLLNRNAADVITTGSVRCMVIRWKHCNQQNMSNMASIFKNPSSALSFYDAGEMKQHAWQVLHDKVYRFGDGTSGVEATDRRDVKEFVIRMNYDVYSDPAVSYTATNRTYIQLCALDDVRCTIQIKYSYAET